MPNEINSFNWNIDKFQSGFLGTITGNDFREWIFSHNLSEINPIITSNVHVSFQDRGKEIDLSTSTNNVSDLPNLTDLANTSSPLNGFTTPRRDNLDRNLQDVNPEVASLGITKSDLGKDVSDSLNASDVNVDLPSLQSIADNASELNNFTKPRDINLEKNPSLDELILRHPVYEYGYWFITERNTYRESYGVPTTLKLGFAGNLESWVNDGGYSTTIHEIRDLNLLSPANNKWGPPTINGQDTGFIQYKTATQGDVRDQLLNRTLGVGVTPFSTIGSGINFKPDGRNITDLDEIGRKRRGIEVLNRVKSNLIDDTIGKINTSPFGLLAGGSLIQKDYKITVPKTKLGRFGNFAAKLAGLNITDISSNIPDDAFQDLPLSETPGTQIDVPTSLLDYTGSATKSLLFNALSINKYGPLIEEAAAVEPPKTKIGQFFNKATDALGGPKPTAPSTKNYLSEPNGDSAAKIDEEKTEAESNAPKGLLGKVVKIFDKTIQKIDSDSKQQKPPTIPYEMEEPSVNPDQYGGFYGKFETYQSVGRSTSEKGGFGEEEAIILNNDGTKPMTKYNGTPVESYTSADQVGVTQEGIDWRPRANKFKRGLLKYTQQMVNDAGRGDAAYYIGYFDSTEALGEKDYKQGNKNHGHLTGQKDPNSKPTLPSKGNTVRNIGVDKSIQKTDGQYYCRSWSSRRKYHNYANLIRNEGSWWRLEEKDKGLMTMDTRSNGQPNMAFSSNFGKMGLIPPNELEGDNAINNWTKYDIIKKGLNASDKITPLVKNYMLSIENLAWKDTPHWHKLPSCEKGPNGGRIMWFPPYDVDFSDSTTVNWDSTSFIGRGEPIYTYNNTERSGTLDFKIVVDHPAVLNELRDILKNKIEDDDIYHSFFAGCNVEDIKELFKDYLPNSESVKPVEIKRDEFKKVEPKQPVPPPYDEITIYFENCFSSGNATFKTLNPNGTTGNTTFDYSRPSGIGRAVDLENYETFYSTIAGNRPNYPLCSGNGLNKGVKEKLEVLAQFLTCTGIYQGQEDGKNYKIEVVGSTSAASGENISFNTKLANDRANNTATYLHNLMLKYEKEPPKVLGTEVPYYKESDMNYGPIKLNNDDKRETKENDRWYIENQGYQPPKVVLKEKTDDDGDPCDSNIKDSQANSKTAKTARFATIKLKPNVKYQKDALADINKKNQTSFEDEQKKKEEIALDAAKAAAKYYITECDYFIAMEKDQPFIYKSLTEKLSNFHPAFHSMTPEGLNSRLTFLQQCTRQGPQLMDDNLPQNMVFGRPPICVLRIGDFYHTKIVIDSCNFTFDPLQWDLNPEGIGVQPMIAKVSIGFKFIGGSSLGGPIRQLQNAVSFNFFANSGIYNPAVMAESVMEDRKKFIFGAFKRPQEADNMYAELGPKQSEFDEATLPEITINSNNTLESPGAQLPENALEPSVPQLTNEDVQDPGFGDFSPKPATPPSVTSEPSTSNSVILDGQGISSDLATAKKIALARAKSKITSIAGFTSSNTTTTILEEKYSLTLAQQNQCDIKIKVEKI